MELETLATTDSTVFTRNFSMPNAETFKLKPVSSLLNRWLKADWIIVDPFARNSKIATITNDLDPNTTAQYHMLADEFVNSRLAGVVADAVIFDPPYSPRQIKEVYNGVGLKCTMKDTQSGRWYKEVKDGLDRVLKPEGIAICCGWNSLGFGVVRNYKMLEILLVTHGGAHNDTIVTVERKRSKADEYSNVSAWNLKSNAVAAGVTSPAYCQ